MASAGNVEKQKDEVLAAQHLSIAYSDSKKLGKIASQIPGAIYQFKLWPDGKNCFPYASKGIKDIYGLDPEEIRDDGSKVMEILFPEDRERVATCMKESAEGLFPWKCEYRVIVGGKVRWVYGSATPERLEEDCILWHGYIQDITERKEAEDQALASSRFVKAITDNSTGLISYWTKDLYCVFANAQYMDWFGYLPNGYFLGDFLGNEKLVQREQYLELVFKGETQSFETTIIKKGEVSCEAFIQYVPDIKDGKVIGFFVFVMDISQVKKLESQLRQALKMEVVGRLAGGVAHDFNNILTAMILNLEEALDGGITRPALEEVHSLATQGAKLTRQLLEFSRQQPMALTPLEINSEIAKLMTMIRRIIGDTIQVELKLDARETWVDADISLLDQALLNMMVNARDAMPEGGALTVLTEEVNLDLPAVPSTKARSGIFSRITIQDTGIGMSAETLEHLFEPFFTTKEVGRGTGLGLASADGTIHQHGGWIDVESRLGVGSTFKIYLPLTDRRPVVEEAPAHVRRSKEETILLVEDHPSVRRITVMVLEKLGYHVLAASDGHEALAIWADHSSKINLLLTDMMMPNGMSGLDLGVRLRADKPLLNIIMVSGFSDEIIQDEGSEMQNIRFLSKPYQNDTLARIIRDVFDGVTSPPDSPPARPAFRKLNR